MSNITTKSQDMFEMMDKAYRFAEIISKSDIIPVHYRNKPENTFIAVQTAYRMNIDPMLVMQNTFVVGGKLGMNTTFAISLANQSGIFKGPFKYVIEGEGNSLKVTAKAIVAKTNEEVTTTVALKMAIDEGWTRNSKYKTMPEHMLTYRAAIFLIRVYCPEVINGMHTIEELEDVKAAEIVTTPSKSNETFSNKAASLNNKISSLVDDEDKKLTLVNQLTELKEGKIIVEEGVSKMLEKLSISDISEMSQEQLTKAIAWAQDKSGAENE